MLSSRVLSSRPKSPEILGTESNATEFWLSKLFKNVIPVIYQNVISQLFQNKCYYLITITPRNCRAFVFSSW